MSRCKLGILWVCVGLWGNILHGQEVLDWDMLAEVSYEYEYNETFNQWIGTPTFPPELKALNGKQVSISGYILPMDVEGEYYVLSAFPYVSCFFCGGAGMESVMELKLTENDTKFKVDEFKAFRGILQLNRKNFELSFTLDQAEIVSQ